MAQDSATPVPDPDKQLKEFLDLWASYPYEEVDCPPDYFLVEASKTDVDQDFAKGSQQATWLKHTESCPHCKRIIQLLRNPAPSKLTLQHILARASRDAEEITSRPSNWRQAHGRAFWTHDNHPLRKIGLQPIAAAALFVILIGGVWSVRRSGFFETPSEVATVSFPKNEAKELVQSLYADVSYVQRARIPRQEEQKYIDDYYQNVKTINKLKEEKKIPNEYRRDIAVLMAQYNSQLERQFALNRDKKPNSTPIADSKLGVESDTQAILRLVNNVDHALSKKNAEVSDVQTVVPDPETITTVFEQIDVKMNDSEVTVYDKVANRSPEEAKALFKGVQWYASQEKRSVFLNQGNETKTIPISTFNQRRPNQ